MSDNDTVISKLEDLDKFKSAPSLSKVEAEMLLNQVEYIIHTADWLTIGIMSPSILTAINAVRRIEEKFNYNAMKCINLPTSNSPIFLKANQKSGEIHARVEYGLGEGILISCHNDDDSLMTRTIGPFPLDFFN